VDPKDAVALTYLMYSGAKFNLALRNPGDNSQIEVEAITLQYLLTAYDIPVPAKVPYAVQPRIDQLISPQLPNDVVVVTEE
jgi:pilus assembly protein CpaB